MRPATIKQVLRGITVPITRLASNEAASIAEDVTLKRTDSLAQPLKKRHGIKVESFLFVAPFVW